MNWREVDFMIITPHGKCFHGTAWAKHFTVIFASLTLIVLLHSIYNENYVITHCSMRIVWLLMLFWYVYDCTLFSDWSLFKFHKNVIRNFNHRIFKQSVHLYMIYEVEISLSDSHAEQNLLESTNEVGTLPEGLPDILLPISNLAASSSSLSSLKYYC